MSKNFLRITGLSLLALYTATTGFADSKVRARYSSGGQSNETTILTKGTRPATRIRRSQMVYSSPMRLMTALKRGSERRLSRRGSTFIQTNRVDRSSYAFSSHSSALFLSPRLV